MRGRFCSRGEPGRVGKRNKQGVSYRTGQSDREVQMGPLGPILDQPSAATRFDRRETLRAAVFLWTTPLDTPRANSGCTRRRASAA
jgi:hypothetical protein